MSQKEYVKLSLELHLFFDRIMKEHSLFLEAAFMEKEKDLKLVARDFQKTFNNILEKTINLADGNISKDFLDADEIVTKKTLEAEKQTSNLSGAPIDTNITLKELNLRNGEINLTADLIDSISRLNKQTLTNIEKLVYFKNDILNQVLSCKLYTFNYPLLIKHIMNEAKMYYNLLNKVESKETFTENYIYEQEIFWNNIMKEHAEFIRGLLDPSEAELIIKADNFAGNYENILKKYATNPIYLTDISLKETINFRDFKITGEEGILNCQVKSIIIPLLADHVVREANHFIRILKNAKRITYCSIAKVSSSLND